MTIQTMLEKRARRRAEHPQVLVAKRFVPRTYARYYPSGNKIAFTPGKWEDISDFENRILGSLVHELTHWATFLKMDEREITTTSRNSNGFPYDKRLIERIAREIERTVRFEGGQ